MSFSVKQLAALSGVSVRTLHWYDEIGLLKPASLSAGGYRRYGEEELLLLQQILFFKEVGFPLKEIGNILKRNDFDKEAALIAHREVLRKSMKRTEKLIRTIDKTVEHLRGKTKMKEKEIYFGFSKEKQDSYQKELLQKLGKKVEPSLDESLSNTKQWKKTDWLQSKWEFEEICKALISLMKEDATPGSPQVQALIERHYEWILKFWTPNKESYTGHGKFILESDLRQAYASFDERLPAFIAEGICIFAERELA